MVILRAPQENIFRRIMRALFARAKLYVYNDNSILFLYQWRFNKKLRRDVLFVQLKSEIGGTLHEFITAPSGTDVIYPEIPVDP